MLLVYVGSLLHATVFDENIIRGKITSCQWHNYAAGWVPLYIGLIHEAYTLQLWRADGRHRLSKPSVSQYTVLGPTHYISNIAHLIMATYRFQYNNYINTVYFIT